MALNLQRVGKKKEIQHILEAEADCCVTTRGTVSNACSVFWSLLERHVWLKPHKT